MGDHDAWFVVWRVRFGLRDFDLLLVLSRWI